MRFFRHILGFVFGMWVSLTFVLAAMFFLPFLFVVFQSRWGSFLVGHRITRLWSSILIRLWLIRIKFYGQPPLDTHKGYVFVSNHRSQLDIPVFIVSNPHPFKFLAKTELTSTPVIGFLLKKLYITVDRESSENKSLIIEQMEKNLLEGTSIYIYPEGTRNRTEQPLREFYDGAFKLAIKTKSPLVVVTIVNSAKVMPPDKLLYLQPGTISVCWETALDVNDLSVEELKAKARKLMLDRLQASTGR